MNCEICLYPYDHSKRKPYVLSCPHRFCLNCMNKLNDKKCPLCQKPIRSKFPNLNLMKTLPESVYDKTRKELDQIVNETIDLKDKLSQHCEIKFNSSLQRVQSQRNEFIQKSNDLIDLIKKNQQILLDEFNSIETYLNQNLTNLKDESNMNDQVKHAKQVLETNELEELELVQLKTNFMNKKQDLNQHLDHLNKFNGNYDILFNQNINVLNGEIAQIKQSQFVNSVENHTTQTATNHLKPIETNVTNTKNNLNSSAKKLVKRYSLLRKETPTKRRRFVH